MANQQDIAKKCGVSVATVSRILKNDPKFNVSDDTKKKVLQTASKLGYKKSNANDTNILNVGIVQAHSETIILQDPYYNEIENALEKRQFENQMSLQKILTTADRNFLYENEQILDGILAIGIFTDDEISKLSKFSKNIVFIDHNPDDFNYFCVMPNFELALKLAINEFFESSHKNIGFIGAKYSLDQRKSNELEYRCDHFKSITKNLGIYNEQNILNSDVSAISGYSVMKSFLETNTSVPSAFFVSSDVIASGVIRAIIEKGLKIPHDISIITFNNTMLSEYALVPLTSISVNLQDLADNAFESMKKLVKKSQSPQKTLIGCNIIKRESVLNK